jgi:hypothetical protein
MPNGHLSGAQAGLLYARWLFLAHELQRTQEGRSSENSVRAKFAEFLFHAIE